jgi:hypothetical protein
MQHSLTHVIDSKFGARSALFTALAPFADGEAKKIVGG